MVKEKGRTYFTAGIISLWLIPAFRGLPAVVLGIFSLVCIFFTIQLWKEEECKHNYVDKEYKVFKWKVWSGKSCTKCTNQISK